MKIDLNKVFDNYCRIVLKDRIENGKTNYGPPKIIG